MKWPWTDWKKKSVGGKILTIVLPTLFLVLGALVAYGVISSRPDGPADRGLIEVFEGKPSSWNREDFKVRVYYASDTEDKVIKGAATAITYFNTTIGEQILLPPVEWQLTFDPSHAPAGTIFLYKTLQFSKPTTRGAVTYNVDKDQKTIRSVNMKVLDGLHLRPQVFIDNIMKHEFGHALGLDHDTIRGTLMFGKIGQSGPLSLTDKDVELLRKLYKGGKE